MVSGNLVLMYGFLFSLMVYGAWLNIALLASMQQADESGTAASKFALLRGHLDATRGTSTAWPRQEGVMFESMHPTVDAVQDDMPGCPHSCRTKYIHSVGVVAAVTFNFIPGNPYTGLFKSGSNHAFARLSVASPPDPKTISFIPGSAFKLYRDGVPSVNFMAMRALVATPSWNFFDAPFSNHISKENLGLALKIVALKFSSVSDWASHVGLSDLARFDESGVKVDDAHINFPHQLLLKPTTSVHTLFPDKYEALFTDQLQTIPSGTVLYDIFASSAPMANFTLIGHITTTSTFVTSTYGDSKLFFKHQRFEEDLRLRPDWIKACPTVSSCPVCPLDVPCNFQD